MIPMPLTEREKKRLKSDLFSWQFEYRIHNRGCYLEALAGELERGTVSKEYVVEVLMGIASLVK